MIAPCYNVTNFDSIVNSLNKDLLYSVSVYVEDSISLNNIKRIYFNVRGSINLRNYKKKQSERFIQFVELNNKKTLDIIQFIWYNQPVFYEWSNANGVRTLL